MKRQLVYLLISVCLAGTAFGCGNQDPGNENSIADVVESSHPEADSVQGAPKTITNKNIPVQDITDFYYTYENINFNAFYQRYRFYVEDGKTMFYHETREKPDEYGWTTEEDITKSGAVELSSEEWKDFLLLLKDGTVNTRSDSAESGGSGPWLYIYWKNDKGKYQEFNFDSWETQGQFEEFCFELASK